MHPTNRAASVSQPACGIGDDPKAPQCWKYISVVCGLAAVIGTRPAAGDGLWQTCPRDGAWAHYSVTVADDSGMGRTGSCILKSVGQVPEGGETCRWIECRFRLEDQDSREDEIDEVVKVLIPERHLTRESNPLDNFVRAWVRTRGEVQRYDQQVHNPMNPLLLILPGKLDDVQPLQEAQTVKSKLGPLRCAAGYQGRSTLPAQRQLTQQVTHQIWPHEDVPFGAALVRQKIRMQNAGRVIENVDVEYVFIESGDNAKSDLPDHR